MTPKEKSRTLREPRRPSEWYLRRLQQLTDGLLGRAGGTSEQEFGVGAERVFRRLLRSAFEVAASRHGQFNRTLVQWAMTLHEERRARDAVDRITLEAIHARLSRIEATLTSALPGLDVQIQGEANRPIVGRRDTYVAGTGTGVGHEGDRGARSIDAGAGSDGSPVVS